MLTCAYIFSILLLLGVHAQQPGESNTTAPAMAWLFAPWSDEARTVVSGLTPFIAAVVIFTILGILACKKEKLRKLADKL